MLTVPRGIAASALVLATAALVSCGHGGAIGHPGSPAASKAPDPIAAGVERIIADALQRKAAYRRLVRLCDGFGHRLSGSKSLEAAIDWVVATMKGEGFANVRREKVEVPRWVRGREDATLIAPRLPGKESVPLVILGLGMSVGTPPAGISAPVIVVRDEAGLKAAGARVAGRIVLFNNPMPKWTREHGTCYGKTVRFRVHGPTMAAALGAKAVLVRSVTARSLRSPHTGATLYGDGQARIPAAAVSTEDADMLQRLYDKGEKPVVRLRMEARLHGNADSANAIAELRGRELPEEVVIVSGHIDSWDVGQGAHDDGAGVAMAMETLAILKRLGLRPRRTVRFVAWTNEENGLRGAKSYVKRHAAAMGRHAAAIEADFGGFNPAAFGIHLRDKKAQSAAAARMRAWMKLLRKVGRIAIKEGSGAPDVSRFAPHGVPVIGLYTHGERYFDYHQTHADTVDKVDPDELARSTAALAALTWLIAEMPGRLGAAQ